MFIALILLTKRICHTQMLLLAGHPVKASLQPVYVDCMIKEIP